MWEGYPFYPIRSNPYSTKVSVLKNVSQNDLERCQTFAGKEALENREAEELGIWVLLEPRL